MGYFRFRKNFKIAPGVKLNFNKKSTGITFGGKGIHYTINSKGTTTKSVGVPGTGLYYTDTKKINKAKKETSNVNTKLNYFNDISLNNNLNSFSEKNNRESILRKTWFIILIMFIFPPFGMFLMWYNKDWNIIIKLLITIVFSVYFIGFFV